MRNGFRILIWASAGFLVSAGWGFYFAVTNKDIPVRLTVYALAALTQPTVAVFVYFNPHYLFGLRAVEIANALTYAFVSFIVESIRRSQILHASN
jgi:hypothetical protein